MWTGILKAWEAMGGTLGLLTFGLLAYAAGLLRGLLRDNRDANARAKEDRGASEQRDRDIRADFTARADRDRAEFKAQAKEYRDLSVREHAQLSEKIAEQSEKMAEQSEKMAEQSKAIAEQSKAIAEQSKAITELFKAVAALQGDVQVLLNRSDRSSGGNVGTGQPTTRYEFARQAAPTPREEEHGKDG